MFVLNPAYLESILRDSFEKITPNWQKKNNQTIKHEIKFSQSFGGIKVNIEIQIEIFF